VLQTTSVIDGSQLSQHTLPQTPLDLISSLPSQGPDPSTSLTVDTSVEYMHSLMRYGQFPATIYAILIKYHIHRKLQVSLDNGAVPKMQLFSDTLYSSIFK